MRIIAGTHRGRRYLPPRDEKTTRPITDRVKQSLFDRLWSLGALPPEGSEDPSEPGPESVRVLDIFSGTGSLGLEALSRGAGHCVFVDMDRDAVGRLERNLSDLQLADRARIVKASALNPIWLAQVKAESIGLIFLDPPYALTEDDRGRQDLGRLMSALAKVATRECVLVYRTSKGVTPGGVDGWDGPVSHTYGSMTLHLFTRRT
jgi:16S rRNA (guanine966-N2)-methyltransferase